MKKSLFMILLVLLLIAGTAQSVFAGGDAEKGSDDGEIVIGVAVGTWDNKALLTQAYYDNYLAPEFNVKFVWAEETSFNAAAIMSFIENLSTMGAKALIDFSALPGDELLAIGAKCDEYGIWYVNNNSAVNPQMTDFSYFGGTGGADPAIVGDQFNEMTSKVLGDGSAHNVILHNGLAVRGIGQHILSAAAVLDSLESEFGLSYKNSDTVDLVKTTKTQTVLDTGSRMKVVLEPTIPVSVDNYYNLLKTGEYDTVIFTAPWYLQTESVVSQIEESLKKNIHLISIAPVAETTANSFRTPDITGNQALDAALIKNNSAGGILFAMAYNCVTGHAEEMKTNGTYTLYDAPMWTCYSLDEYEKIAQLDVPDGQYYTYRIDDIKQMLFDYNADLTAAKMHEYATAVSDLSLVLSRNGLN